MSSIFKQRLKLYTAQMPFGANLYNHLMDDGYMPDSWVIPPFLEVKKMNTNRRGDGIVREALVVYAPKSSSKWREFHFLHPNNYQRVCDVLKESDYQKTVKALNKSKKIFSYSLPQSYSTKSQDSKKSIQRWSDLQEDLLLLSGEYGYILQLDISNCYPSMYTHTIEWACESVGYKGFGERLDSAVRSGMETRTHGLPVGSSMTHYVAETVLLAIDRSIEKGTRVKGYIGGRFRDNYYFLCKNKHDSEMLLKDVAKCLRKYHQNINSEKTKILSCESYFNEFWRIDFNTNKIKLGLQGISEGEIVPVSTVEAFVGLSLRLSELFKNDKAIIERTLDTLDGVKVGKESYPKYFNLLQRMYLIRTQALPRVLSRLFELANSNSYCNDAFKRFLAIRINLASKSKDEFEILWLVYFMSLVRINSHAALKALKEQDSVFCRLMMDYYKESLKGSINSSDRSKTLWPIKPNTSDLSFKFKEFDDPANVIDWLKIKFSY